MLAITNGKIVQEHRILEGYALLIEQERIYDIVPEAALAYMELDEVVNAYGGYVTPGFIDMHSDHIEAMAAPRPSSIMDMELAVYEFEKECCTHGITTMFHSVSIWEGVGASPMRRPELVKQLADIIEKSHSQLHLIHHRFHMRFEIDNQEQFPLMLDYLRQKRVHLISFMDHTPGQGQYRNIEVYKNYVRNARHMSDEDVEAEVNRRMNSEKLTLENIREAASLAQEQGISIASHDDDTKEKLDVVQSIGATISEFPITLEVAKEAKRRGMYTVVGAPNILLGGSHSGNMNAADAIVSAAADILCSDYYPASLLHAVFQMTKQGQRLQDMIAMVTIQPARATGIDQDYGSIEKGKKADLLIIRTLPNDLPAITEVFVDGMCIAQNHYRV
ncbi:phosphonate metabolism protein PhnM [Erysipelotrichaceae bacterium AF15-26LB]|nr:phosphonate metabolism protein PhnM [Erysipelotrichaceae bacterium 3_1_53]MCR0347449.1 phosphonate metabolism protein PhnM [[Clostridium] innocuum]RJV85600.1 phosphonate metabolism protein PhnM [Erysipelotrichaceae bacterium AF19-24AC]RJV88646.1 phosphonate metabolism protein PhnM [Erysipelotrichaceae bacterium AF15-26LB]